MARGRRHGIPQRTPEELRHLRAAGRVVGEMHAALRAADCLIPAFASGTNVNDLVIALVDPQHDR